MPLYRDRSASADATLAAAQAFVAALVNTPDDLIANWLLYVLEAIDGWVVDSTYAEMLADLRASIDGRLTSGGW
jgi:hypothetical protein